MNSEIEVTEEEVDRRYLVLNSEAESGGYHLNTDIAFTKDLVRGLLVNEKRYGYPACPCRLASGEKAKDLDIICPCDYRDPDLNEYDCCYCALYISQAAVDGVKKVGPIPERRPPEEERMKAAPRTVAAGISSLSLPVWRCRVCGYLCARDDPPEACPICRAKKERFERFI
jgi:ferredoxin-thioredoxin reductase catalytic subunit